MSQIGENCQKNKTKRKVACIALTVSPRVSSLVRNKMLIIDEIKIKEVRPLCVHKLNQPLLKKNQLKIFHI